MNPWALVASFFLVGLILVLALILDPMGDEPEDHTRPGFPADNRHERHR